MGIPNRDTISAIVLLLLCSVLFWASFDIRSPDYGILLPSAWPRAVLAVLAFFSLLFLAQSLRPAADDPMTPEADEAGYAGFRGWLRKYQNPIWCYVIYFVFLAALPVLGALIGGILLVFGLLTALEGGTPGKMALHAAIAVISIGAMWALFSFGLRVILPQGMIFSIL